MTNEYWPVEPGKTSREKATGFHLQTPLSADRSAFGVKESGEAAADLQHVGIALCAASSLMMGSAATLAFIYLF